MGLREKIKRLEEQASELDGRELCPHAPPIIQWPDGIIENESAHECGKPRLTITIGYSDGSDRRTQMAALSTYDDARARFGDLTPEWLAGMIMKTFPVTEETRRVLYEKTR